MKTASSVSSPSPFPFMPRMQWCVFRLGIRVAISDHLRHGGSSEAVPPTSILAGETGMHCMSFNGLGRLRAAHCIQSGSVQDARDIETSVQSCQDCGGNSSQWTTFRGLSGVHFVPRHTGNVSWSGEY
ncbi:hypothetical protein CGRA01v4_10230 [Colletotrichum graminicola]|nr:hypothetical protein CGRA01v4_10230 [Colletotrichum graminicola]